MLHAGNSASAVGRGLPTSQDTTDSYKVVLPRLPTGNVVLNTVFLHADLKGRPYRAPDFRDALAQILDLREILCIGQYQMSHVWMVTCESSSSKQKLVKKAEFPVKGLRCMVFDPDTKNVKVKLLWLPRYMEHRRIVEALEPYGTVQSVEREKWRCPGMEHMETANRELSLTLKDGVSASTIPHTLNVYGVQALVLIPGRPPLCLRCSRVGHARRQCRTPRCTQCRRFGHTAENCVLSYADRLRQGQWSREDDVASEHIMDVSEVVDATGELSHEHRIDGEQKTSTPQNNTEYEATGHLASTPPGRKPPDPGPPVSVTETAVLAAQEHLVATGQRPDMPPVESVEAIQPVNARRSSSDADSASSLEGNGETCVASISGVSGSLSAVSVAASDVLPSGSWAEALAVSEEDMDSTAPLKRPADADEVCIDGADQKAQCVEATGRVVLKRRAMSAREAANLAAGHHIPGDGVC
ncbi:uncharacterized protein LOC144097455 [Amblyomma americanum]